MKVLLYITLFFITPALFAQKMADNAYWLFLTDKNENGFSINMPYEFLSERSVERRGWQGIPITERDLPVTSAYIDSLKNLGLEIRHKSKWLNGVLVSTSDLELLDTIYEMSFIDSLMWTPNPGKVFYPAMPTGSRFDSAYSEPPNYSYGFADDQIGIMNLDYLHNKGYTGKGVLIAVLDAGFIDMPELRSFQKTYAENRVLHTKNFVNKSAVVYGDHSHGTYVSSIIVANWPDTIMGSAPDASLLLAITENVYSETKIEEYSWIEGAEWADSLGADVINTSLGYTTFDDSLTNYTYEDMDGKTAHISVANSMTSATGMISVTSAGNNGNDSWYYIGAPADAENIIAAGAVDQFRNIAGFSSRGPTYDARIKPELMAMGSGTIVQAPNGAARGGGTSFSSPLIAGAVASLWQAYPTMEAGELMQWIIKSGDRYDDPDGNYGFGIPSFSQAYHAITSVTPPTVVSSEPLMVYPVPANERISFTLPEEYAGIYRVKVFDLSGKELYRQPLEVPGAMNLPPEINRGVYIIELSNENHIFKSRIIRN